MEEWFAAYPTAGQGDLRARFRSVNEHNHAGAFFELYCYALLTKQGYTVRLHPTLSSGKRAHPDFIALVARRRMFFLESTVAAQRTHEEEKYLNQLYDYLDRKLRAPDFFVRVSVIGDVPKSTPPLSAICAKVQAWISGLDADAVVRRVARMGVDELLDGREHPQAELVGRLDVAGPFAPDDRMPPRIVGGLQLFGGDVVR